MWNNRTSRMGYGNQPVSSRSSVDLATYDFVKTSNPRKIITYTGSKDRLLPQLVWLAKDAAKRYDLTRYLEPFGGSGALLLNHQFLFDQYWYNEANTAVYSLMLALSDVRYVHSVIDRLKVLGVGKRVFHQAKKELDLDEKGEKLLTLVERAVYAYITIMQSYGGGRESFNPIFARNPKEEKRYYTQVQKLDTFLPFLSQVKMTNEDALKLLKDTLYEGARLIFADPPYHPEAYLDMSGNRHYGKY